MQACFSGIALEKESKMAFHIDKILGSNLFVYLHKNFSIRRFRCESLCEEYPRPSASLPSDPRQDQLVWSLRIG